MKELRVDFRSPWQPTRWAWAGLGIVCFVAVVMVVLAVREAREVEALRAELAELQRLQGERRAASELAPASKRKPYDESAREMLALATAKWPELLTALESVEIVGVTPSGFEIHAAERWIRVDVEFSDYAKLLEYIAALNAATPAPRWSLIQAQTGTRPGSSPAGATSTATLRGTW